MIAERLLTQVLRHKIKTLLQLEWKKIPFLPAPVTDNQYMLYVHVPFCEVLCPYCSFNRFPFNEDSAHIYFERLRQEMQMVAKLGYKFNSMYIGGGTPTMLIDELISTIDMGRELFGLADVSCETNPNHLTSKVVGKLIGKVQRLSVGVQSFDDGLLKQIARYDRFGCGEAILERIRDFSGEFSTFNIDLIFNFPSQTEDIIRRDAEMVIASGANQVSCYPLMTASSVSQSINKEIGKVDYWREERFYRILSNTLADAFRPSSAWTFSRKGGKMIDEYIAEFEEYVGIGSGSFSYLGGCLFVNTFSLQQYDHMIGSGLMSVAAQRQFSVQDRMRYRFMMDLFGLSLDRQHFKNDFGVPVELGLWAETAFMGLSGAFDTTDAKRMQLTPRGRYLEVVMMREFFSALDNVREQARMALDEDEKKQLAFGR